MGADACLGGIADMRMKGGVKAMTRRSGQGKAHDVATKIFKKASQSEKKSVSVVVYMLI